MGVAAQYAISLLHLRHVSLSRLMNDAQLHHIVVQNLKGAEHAEIESMSPAGAAQYENLQRSRVGPPRLRHLGKADGIASDLDFSGVERLRGRGKAHADFAREP